MAASHSMLLRLPSARGRPMARASHTPCPPSLAHRLHARTLLRAMIRVAIVSSSPPKPRRHQQLGAGSPGSSGSSACRAGREVRNVGVQRPRAIWFGQLKVRKGHRDGDVEGQLFLSTRTRQPPTNSIEVGVTRVMWRGWAEHAPRRGVAVHGKFCRLSFSRMRAGL